MSDAPVVEEVVDCSPIDIDPDLLAYFLSDPSYVVCPKCNNVWENAGAGNEADCKHVKTENGKLLSAQAREHYTTHRFRCQRCESNFCSSCKLIPYHIGFSCEEFENIMKSLKCRWCKERITQDSVAASGPPKDPARMVCAGCQEKETTCLNKTFACGHPAIWHQSMSARAPPDCIEPECVSKQNDPLQTTTSEDYCSICWVEELGAAPCLKLNCGHIFHADCVKDKLKHRWAPGTAVSISFLQCPLCKAPIDWPATCQPYTNTLRELQELRSDLSFRCIQQLKLEGMDDETLNDNQRLDLAMRKFNFFECFKCKSFYYGGRKECDAGHDHEDDEESKSEEAKNETPEILPNQVVSKAGEEFICGGCKATCPTHGSEQMAYKCRFCCSVASFYCFGHTHFCESCHQKPWSLVSQTNYHFIIGKLDVCPGKDKCPLGVDHPPNGEEYVLGCGACGNFVVKNQVDLHPK